MAKLQGDTVRIAMPSILLSLVYVASQSKSMMLRDPSVGIKRDVRHIGVRFGLYVNYVALRPAM